LLLKQVLARSIQAIRPSRYFLPLPFW
jgi:hypothetical protein